MTWKSTIMSVSNCGLKPVLVDINKDNSNINLVDLKKKISKNKKQLLLCTYMEIQQKLFK